MTEKKNRKYYGWFLLATVLWILCLTGCGDSITNQALPQESGQKVESTLPTSSGLTYHAIDVGQGDSTLIEADGHFMLIDAGEKVQGPVVVSYLKDQGVETLDYVIGTHPHSDHIGGMEAVIREFDVKKVILPEKEHTTMVYENLLSAIADKNLKITLPKVGDRYELGDAVFLIISPGKDYGDDLNNWSVGIELTYGKNRFVLCGDAEKEEEADMVQQGVLEKADVLKLSHHGSKSSSSPGFMDAVQPSYGIISCGKDNDYGHPHKEIETMLKERNITYFRTDELGTIVIKSDGTNLIVPKTSESITDTFVETNKEPISNMKSAAASKTLRREYIVNINTKKFHLPDCKYANSMKIENRKSETGTREELIHMGYEPCKTCNP